MQPRNHAERNSRNCKIKRQRLSCDCLSMALWLCHMLDLMNCTAYCFTLTGINAKASISNATLRGTSLVSDHSWRIFFHLS